MSQDDPFATWGNDDRTVVRPMPGGHRPGAPTAPPTPGRPAAPAGAAPLPQRGGLNPLENAASVLLDLLPRLKTTPGNPDPEALLHQTVTEVQGFETRARQLGVTTETIRAARYVLCTALDEAVLNTPWGNNSIWNRDGLLVSFHREARGGEKVFVLLEQLLRDPATNLHLLELIYLCLALGFEGRYALTDDGHRQLDDLREQLYRTIRTQRGEFERALSPHWQGVVDRRNPLARYVPLWVYSALAAALLLALYLGFNFGLNNASDPVFAQLRGLHADTGALPPRPETILAAPLPEPTPVSNIPGLAELLQPDVRGGRIALRAGPDGTTIVIRGDGLFRSGRATVNPALRPLLERIGEALNQLPGPILVTGHSDSVPIRTLRFPSNWHLSRARAQDVAQRITARMDDAARVRAEGRAATEPLVRNERSPADRARNRRVEITLEQ